MLGKIDNWISESLLYIDFKQKEKGQDKFFRLALLLVLSLTVFLNCISIAWLISLLGLFTASLEPIIPLCLSLVVILFLYMRYQYRANYISISNKRGYNKKLWGTTIIYIVSTFILMWTLIIYAMLAGL